VKIDQKLVSKAFQIRNDVSSTYYDNGDIHKIRELIQREYGVTISESEAIDFWRWRSSEWDASFLRVTSDSEVLSWFRKFIMFVLG
jgi:hypothetical protein